MVATPYAYSFIMYTPHAKIYTCTYLHICITFAQISIRAHIYYTYMYTCTSMDMRRHRYVQPIHVYLCVYCTHTPYTPTHKDVYMHIFTYMYYICTNKYTCTYILHIYVYMYIYGYAQTSVCTARACVPMCILYTYTIHVCICVYTHIRRCTYIHPTCALKVCVSYIYIYTYIHK